MRTVLEFSKEFLRPGSAFCIVVGLAVGVSLLYAKPTARWGRRWLTAMVLVYWFISIPIGADWLSAGLGRQYRSLQRLAEAGGATAIVVLSGGSRTYRANGRSLVALDHSSAFRVIEAARLYRLLDGPLVIVSGGIVRPELQDRPESEVLRDGLVQLGVPAERIELESVSKNTRDEALQVKSLLEARRIDRFVLVTSPTHMPRAMAAFEAQGLAPVASVSAARSEGIPELPALLPNDLSRFLSEGAIYEYAALTYYWAHGWLRQAPAARAEREGPRRERAGVEPRED